MQSCTDGILHGPKPSLSRGHTSLFHLCSPNVTRVYVRPPPRRLPTAQPPAPSDPGFAPCPDGPAANELEPCSELASFIPAAPVLPDQPFLCFWGVSPARYLFLSSPRLQTGEDAEARLWGKQDVGARADAWGDGFKVVLSTTLLHCPSARALLSRSHWDLLGHCGTAQL